MFKKSAGGKKNSLHKHIKHFTILVVPDSSAKVRSLKAPFWFFCTAAALLGCVVVVAAFFQIRSGVLLRKAERPVLKVEAPAEIIVPDDSRIAELEGSMDMMRTSFNDELERLLGDLEGHIMEKDGYAAELAELDAAFSVLQSKSRIIEDYKLEIMNVLDYLDEADMHIAFDETVFATNALPIGGPGVPEDYTIADLLMDYDARLEEVIYELRIFKISVESMLPIVDTMPSGWPVESREIYSNFGRRPNPFSDFGYEMHYGVDIAASIGTPVYATAGGVVEYSGFSDNGHGNMVVLAHEYGYSTVYSHNSELLVSEGDIVSRGDLIALAGNSGRTTGAHCHYEVKLNGVNLDPVSFLVEAFG